MSQPRTVCWFSAGAASAVCTKLILSEGRNGEVAVVRCDTGAEHEDNDRFQRDCEQWFGVQVELLKNKKYEDTWDLWERRKFLASRHGAPCTVSLKVEPRLDFQRVNDRHVFGYTADASDVARADRLREHFFELTIETPLIDRGITKAAALDMLLRAGVTPPLTYALGFSNANCLPCPKATSPDYWSLIRKEFPDKFERMAKLSRDLGCRLTRINDVRIYIDEIPEDWKTTNPIIPECDFLCAIAEKDLKPEEKA